MRSRQRWVMPVVSEANGALAGVIKDPRRTLGPLAGSDLAEPAPLTTGLCASSYTSVRLRRAPVVHCPCLPADVARWRSRV
jgi:hypothetical protein